MVLNLYYVKFINGDKILQKLEFSNKEDLFNFLHNGFQPFFFHKLSLEDSTQSKEIDLVYALWIGNDNYKSLGFPDLSVELDKHYQAKPVEYHITNEGYAYHDFTDFFIKHNLKKQIEHNVQKEHYTNRLKFSHFKSIHLNYSTHII